MGAWDFFIYLLLNFQSSFHLETHLDEARLILCDSCIFFPKSCESELDVMTLLKVNYC